jgi:hypothetical protein
MSTDKAAHGASDKAADDGRSALLLVMLDSEPGTDDDEFNRWYFEEHVAERLALPGFRSARRFEAVEGSPRYLAIYELDSLETLATPEYRVLAHSPLIGNNVDDPVGSQRTMEMLARFRNVRRNVYVELRAEDFSPDKRTPNAEC